MSRFSCTGNNPRSFLLKIKLRSSSLQNFSCTPMILTNDFLQEKIYKNQVHLGKEEFSDSVEKNPQPAVWPLRAGPPRPRDFFVFDPRASGISQYLALEPAGNFNFWPSRPPAGNFNFWPPRPPGKVRVFSTLFSDEFYSGFSHAMLVEKKMTDKTCIKSCNVES